ncbi:peroxiredoxin family protein [Ornithinimicrobium flavum]|uniref:peroxiredoxin family protein n=1 Tax=Ornithinimicrobium flavum TaxID=1288636 RepID=UPI00106F3CE4|nr:peroxiredoxin family protein [Ornithinimicrobium flavum]
MTTKQQQARRQAHVAQIRLEQRRQTHTQQRRRLVGLAGLLVLVTLVIFGLWQARPTTNEGGGGAAPDFTLPSTTGQTVSLSDHRGRPVILYFNEGAGCGSCTQQMAEIEKNPGFADAGIVVLPIVMNTAAQIQADLDTFGVSTPYLLDDGTVSQAYGTLGKGMHAGLPGHGFVLVDADGVQRWQGDYPSMWLDPDDLLRDATSRL